MVSLDKELRSAIREFWQTRDRQANSQGAVSGKKDAGLRSAVTAGKHLDGFLQLCRKLLTSAGLPDVTVHWASQTEIPGYFRAEKSWDLLAVADGHLLAAIEFKAQVGPSFGNNFNNRTEESLGNAFDLWAAYREGAFKPSQRPWLGYVFILEDCPKSQRPIKVAEPHFPVFPSFVGASYAKRYELLLTRLVRERLYDSCSLILTSRANAAKGNYTCPNEELGFLNFATSLTAHASAFVGLRENRQ